MAEIECNKIESEFSKKLDDIADYIRNRARRIAEKKYLESTIHYIRKFSANEIETAINSEITEIKNDILKDLKRHRKEEFEDLQSMIENYKDECNIMDEIKFNRKIWNETESGSKEIVRKFVIAHVDSFSYDNGNGNEGGKLFKEIPEALLEAMRIKEEMRTYYNNEVDDIKFIDLSENKITDMCDLDKLHANQIFIKDNPIERIKFADEKQFLNIVYLNDFDTTRLPYDIKRGLTECRREIETIVELSMTGIYGTEDIDEPYETSYMDDESVSRIMSYAEACDSVYKKIQNSDMCT